MNREKLIVWKRNYQSISSSALHSLSRLLFLFLYLSVFLYICLSASLVFSLPPPLLLLFRLHPPFLAKKGTFFHSSIFLSDFILSTFFCPHFVHVFPAFRFSASRYLGLKLCSPVTFAICFFCLSFFLVFSVF